MEQPDQKDRGRAQKRAADPRLYTAELKSYSRKTRMYLKRPGLGKIKNIFMIFIKKWQKYCQ